MSTPAAPPEAVTPYWSQPSTRWDVIKTVGPILAAALWVVINLYFDNRANAQKLSMVEAKVVTFQEAKEERIKQIAVIQTQQEYQGKDISEIKGDVKDIRQDMKTLLSRPR